MVLLFGAGDGGHASIGLVYAIAAAASHGFGAVYVRRFLTGSALTGVVMAAAQQISGALVLTGPLLASDLGRAGEASGASWRALVALAVVSSGVAYVLYYDVIRSAGATTAASVMYLMPVVSTIAGLVALDEHVGSTSLIGGVVIVFGVVWAARAGSRPVGPDQAVSS